MRKRFDRKAWLRIVEAFLAILIILTALLVIMSRQEERADITGSVHEKQSEILEIISKDNALRNETITTTTSENNAVINNAIKKMAPNSWNFSTRICNLAEACGMTTPDKEIYVSERIITSTLDDYAPKKLRLFVWIK